MKEKTSDIDILEEKEKEAIKDLEEYLHWEELQGFSMLPRDKHIETLLNLVSTLIAENKELKEENEKMEELIENSECDMSTNYIRKSKVEEEIDKLNKKEKDLQNSISDEEREEYSDANISFDLMDIDIRRETLQSLLRKE